MSDEFTYLLPWNASHTGQLRCWIAGEVFAPYVVGYVGEVELWAVAGWELADCCAAVQSCARYYWIVVPDEGIGIDSGVTLVEARGGGWM